MRKLSYLKILNQGQDSGRGLRDTLKEEDTKFIEICLNLYYSEISRQTLVHSTEAVACTRGVRESWSANEKYGECTVSNTQVRRSRICQFSKELKRNETKREIQVKLEVKSKFMLLLLSKLTTFLLFVSILQQWHSTSVNYLSFAVGIIYGTPQ